jgi:hypothetical protein
MRISPCAAVALAVALPAAPAAAQPQSVSPAATVLASGSIASVVDLPLFFRLYRVRFPAAQRAPYEGSSTILYDLSGPAALDIDGATHPLAEGTGTFIAAGQTVTIGAGQSAPAEFLFFILTARPNERRPLFERPESVAELFRTEDPLPGLRAGPYEFSLSRATFPAGTPPGPADYRSGAALDYVLSGTGALTADGKTEALTAETSLIEGYRWAHQWANPGEAPFVLLQANISREGDAAVVPAGAK